MSDLHAAFRSRTLEELDDVFKTQHPEYLMAPMTDRQLPSELTEQRLWVALEYTHPEVRQHRLDYIAKTATIHDFDGYELDFNRMGIHFPMGQGRQKTHLMTDLMQQIRDRLNAIGEERGRPYTLAVHVMDSLETNLEIGLDVGTWAREGLVDVLLVGLGYMRDQLAIGQWVRLAGETGVQVYPSINPNTMRAGAWETLRGEPLFREGMRAYADYYLNQGADGIYLFNFRHEPTQRLTEEEFEGVLSELGERETMAGKDKVYAINPTAHSGGPFYHGSEPALLPIVLDRVERKLRFQLGPAAEDPQASLRLSVFTAKAGKGTTLLTRLKHAVARATAGWGVVPLQRPCGCGPQRHERGGTDLERPRRRPLRRSDRSPQRRSCRIPETGLRPRQERHPARPRTGCGPPDLFGDQPRECVLTLEVSTAVTQQ